MPLLVILLLFFLDEVCNSSIFLTSHVQITAAKCLMPSTPVTTAEKPLLSGADIRRYCSGHSPVQLKGPREAPSSGLAGACCSWISRPRTSPAAMPPAAAACRRRWPPSSPQLESVGGTGQGTRCCGWAQHSSGALQPPKQFFLLHCAYRSTNPLSAEERWAQTTACFRRPPLYHFVRERSHVWYNFFIFFFICNSLISVTLTGFPLAAWLRGSADS